MSVAAAAPEFAESPDELFGFEALADPHPLYARLRREAPVARVGDSGVHLVATWDLIEEVLRREADFSAHLTGVLVRDPEGTPGVFPFPDAGANHVIATADEPEHRVHRALAQPRLAASRVASLEERIRGFAEEALRPWIEAGGGDFVPLAEVVPARAVAYVLGLPDGDVSRHRTWAMMGGDMLAGAVTGERLQRMGREFATMRPYLREHLDAAGRIAGPDAEVPLLTALARGVERGEIDLEVAIGIAIVMFGAGGESTAGLIGSCALRLASEPEWLPALRRQPDQVARFVEEVARLESPFKFHYRVVRRACTLGGVSLAPGDRLMLLWASANRDATRFEEPDRLRLDRRHPKQHLGFGRGSHFCIGAPLARLEARVVVEGLVACGASLRLRDADPPVYTPSIFVRRLERLHLDLA